RAPTLRLLARAAVRAAGLVVQRPERLVPRRDVRLLALADRPDGGRDDGGDRVRVPGRARPPARLLRNDAAAHGRDRGRVLYAGPPRLLRDVRGDADPALRTARRLGRRRTVRRDVQIRCVHDGGLAVDAGRDHRRRAVRGHVRPRQLTDELFRLDLSRLRRRVRGEGAALPLPRLAAGRVPRGIAGGVGRPQRRRVEGGRVRLPADRDREVPRSYSGLQNPAASPGGREPRLRL